MVEDGRMEVADVESGPELGPGVLPQPQDLEAGRRLELGCMTGAIVELAGLLDVDVPHTAAVHACTKLLGQLRLQHQGGR